MSIKLDQNVISAVEKDIKEGILSYRAIGRLHGIHNTTVMSISDRLGYHRREIKKTPTVVPQSTPEPERFDRVRKILRKGPKSTDEIANDLDFSPKRVKQIIADMESAGFMLGITVDGKHQLLTADVLETAVHQKERSGGDGYWTHRFGVVSDQHMCNKHHRADVLKDAYDTFAAQGIKDVYNCGNYIDGEARFNKMELITPPGLRHQLQYVIDHYPQRDGITTHYIDGDDHEGWSAQREGVIPGRMLASMAREQGRTDLNYLGYSECDIELKAKHGSIVMRVAHPGGGSSYATSYAPQKIVESLQGGEKPQILLLGHYHKMGYFYPREVHTMLVPCMTDQSLFMRKHKIQANVGFAILNIKQNPDTGVIERTCPEFFPYFDRRFYMQDYE